MKCLALSTVTAVILIYFTVTTATTAMPANSNKPKAPAASGQVTARPQFPALSYAEVTRQEKVFLKGLQNKAIVI